MRGRATDDELIRLARDAFPIRPDLGEDERDVPDSITENVDTTLELSSATGAAIIEFHIDHPRNREALHAALLVLAGEDPREVCICAAIRLPSGRIVRGHRHGDCIRTASEHIDHRHSIGLEPGPWRASMCEDQGFITSRNRYVGREEGLALQHAAGIPSACPSGYRKRELFSEDLY